MSICLPVVRFRRVKISISKFECTLLIDTAEFFESFDDMLASLLVLSQVQPIISLNEFFVLLGKIPLIWIFEKG